MLRDVVVVVDIVVVVVVVVVVTSIIIIKNSSGYDTAVSSFYFEVGALILNMPFLLSFPSCSAVDV